MDRKNDRPAGAGVVSAYARIRKIRREDDFFHINRPAPRFFCLMISPSSANSGSCRVTMEIGLS